MLATLQQMGQGFIHALTWLNLLAMVGGVTLGIVIGCLPGLSAAMGVALMLPLTFTMPTDTGLIVLGAIYCGAIFGGSISAILIHTPGTPASAATAIEGYQMTLQGKAGKALATACWSSFWGGLLSCISLYFFAPALAQLALKFMSAEKFWLGIFGLTIIAGVSSKSIIKGLMSGALGLLISCIGLDPIDGTQRFMFGQAFLAEGINVTCALIGLFSMSQVFILAEKKIVDKRLQILFDLLSVDTAVNVQNKRLVFLHGFEDLQKPLLPGFVGLFLVKRFPGILKAGPFHKIVNILEMVVKGHAVDPAILRDIRHRDLGERLFQQQVFQRLLQSPLCYLRHKRCAPPLRQYPAPRCPSPRTGAGFPLAFVSIWVSPPIAIRSGFSWIVSGGLYFRHYCTTPG